MHWQTVKKLAHQINKDVTSVSYFRVISNSKIPAPNNVYVFSLLQHKLVWVSLYDMFLDLQPIYNRQLT